MADTAARAPVAKNHIGMAICGVSAVASLWAGLHYAVFPLLPLQEFAHTHLAPLTGDKTTARLLLMEFAALLPALVVPYVGSVFYRHWLTASVGAAFVSFVFGAEGLMHIVVPSMAVYFLQAFCRWTGLLSRYRHVLCAVFSFAYLMWRHSARSGVTSTGIDDSTLLMVLAIKLYTLNYNLYDASPEGQQDTEKATAALASGLVRKGTPADEARRKAEGGFKKERERRALTELPDTIEFLGYCLNYCTVFVGPSFEISEYLASQRQNKPCPGGGSSYLSSRLLPAVWKLLQGLAWMAAVVLVASHFPTTRIVEYATSKPLLEFVLFTIGSVIFSRHQYYSVWKLSEAAAVLAGFGYRPEGGSKPGNAAVRDFGFLTGGWDFPSFMKRITPSVDSFGVGIAGLADWEGCSNVNPASVESSCNLQQNVSQWNIHTQSWLAKYVFMRTPAAGGANKYITFLFSAFWHGFLPGYYLAFMTWLWCQECTRIFMAAVEGSGLFTFEPAKAKTSGSILARILTGTYIGRVLLYVPMWALTVCTMAYGGAAFMTFSLENALIVWGRLYYIGHVIPAVLLLLSFVLPRKRSDREGGKKGEGKKEL